MAYPTYLGSFEENNPQLVKTLLTVEKQDLNNLLFLIGTNQETTLEEKKDRLKFFFDSVFIKQLQALPTGWNIPRHLLPNNFHWLVCAILKDQRIIRLIVPQQPRDQSSLQKKLEEQGLTVTLGQAIFKDNLLTLILADQLPQQLPNYTFTLAGGSIFNVRLDKSSIELAKQIDDLYFDAEFSIQGSRLKAQIPYRGLEIGLADVQIPPNHHFPLWTHVYRKPNGIIQIQLPKDPYMGEGIILPKSFREIGVMVGDQGSISYLSPTASMLQEQQIPIYVAGFYDPGIIPIGGKFILANQEVTSLIRASHQQDDKTSVTNGINIRFDCIGQASLVKAKLLQALKEKGISRYWNIETYQEYEFTKEIMHELQSQKNLFMLIAIVIILVACSNIISMLIILVNDKKVEIGILRSMGASSKSIACIFGLSGAAIGILGSTAGILAAMVTLYNLDILVALLSKFQGHDMFSSNLYGQTLPSELSLEALSFVIIATICLSLLAGVVPAIKACLLKPSHILKLSGD